MAAAVSLTACSDTTVDGPPDSIAGPDINLGRRHDVPLRRTAGWFMSRAGCSAVTGRPPVGAIAFYSEDHELLKFDCRGKDRSTVSSAISDYLVERLSRPGISQAMTGHWELTTISTEYCTRIDMYEVLPNGDKIYNYSYWVESTCQWIERYRVEWVGAPGSEPVPWTDCCGGPGGPGDGGDDPPPPPPPPDSNSVTIEWDPSSDHGERLDPPDCNQPQTKLGDQWWCSGRVPKINDRQKIDDALSRMRQIGGICSTLADTVSAVMGRGALRLHGSGGTGYASSDSAGSYMTINQGFTTEWYDSDHMVELGDANGPTGFEVDLQFVLAHEAEHLLNLDTPHLGVLVPDKWKMAHTDQCSGLGDD